MAEMEERTEQQIPSPVLSFEEQEPAVQQAPVPQAQSTQAPVLQMESAPWQPLRSLRKKSWHRRPT